MLFVGLLPVHLSLFSLFHLLHKHFVIAHLRHHVLGFLPSVNEDVDSLVELVQVDLHVLLLRLEILRFLIRIELVQSRGTIIDNISILRLAAV